MFNKKIKVQFVKYLKHLGYVDYEEAIELRSGHIDMQWCGEKFVMACRMSNKMDMARKYMFCEMPDGNRTMIFFYNKYIIFQFEDGSVIAKPYGGERDGTVLDAFYVIEDQAYKIVLIDIALDEDNNPGNFCKRYAKLRKDTSVYGDLLRIPIMCQQYMNISVIKNNMFSAYIFVSMRSQYNLHYTDGIGITAKFMYGLNLQFTYGVYNNIIYDCAFKPIGEVEWLNGAHFFTEDGFITDKSSLMVEAGMMICDYKYTNTLTVEDIASRNFVRPPVHGDNLYEKTIDVFRHYINEIGYCSFRNNGKKDERLTKFYAEAGPALGFKMKMSEENKTLKQLCDEEFEASNAMTGFTPGLTYQELLQMKDKEQEEEEEDVPLVKNRKVRNDVEEKKDNVLTLQPEADSKSLSDEGIVVQKDGNETLSLISFDDPAIHSFNNVVISDSPLSSVEEVLDSDNSNNVVKSDPSCGSAYEGGGVFSPSPVMGSSTSRMDPLAAVFTPIAFLESSHRETNNKKVKKNARTSVDSIPVTIEGIKVFVKNGRYEQAFEAVLRKRKNMFRPHFRVDASGFSYYVDIDRKRWYCTYSDYCAVKCGLKNHSIILSEADHFRKYGHRYRRRY